MRAVLVILLIAVAACWALSAQDTTSLRRCPGSRWRRCAPVSADCHPDDVIDEVISRRTYSYSLARRFGFDRSRAERKCLTGCKVCVKELNFCPAVACPAFIPPCEDGRLTNQVLFMGGRQCKGCLTCVKKPSCPERSCAPAPPKQACRHLQTVGTTTLPDGTVCEGCPFCDPKDIICLPLPCPNPGNCIQTNTNFFDFFGKKCPGCPSPCPIEPIQPVCPRPQICPACVPPPNYVSPPPDEDGCTPCPPCGIFPADK